MPREPADLSSMHLKPANIGRKEERNPLPIFVVKPEAVFFFLFSDIWKPNPKEAVTDCR